MIAARIELHRLQVAGTYTGKGPLPSPAPGSLWALVRTLPALGTRLEQVDLQPGTHETAPGRRGGQVPALRGDAIAPCPD